MKGCLIGITAIIGVVLLFGSVGAIELGNISLLRGTIQTAIGVVMVGASAYFSGAMK